MAVRKPKPQFVLVTLQPHSTGVDFNAYGPSPDQAKLEGAGHLLADGASPPMQMMVLALQAAKWDSL